MNKIKKLIKYITSSQAKRHNRRCGWTKFAGFNKTATYKFRFAFSLETKLTMIDS